MKLITAVLGIAAMCAIGISAQAQTTREKETRTIEVKDGKKISVSGCLKKNPGGGYMLMDGAGDLQYALVTDRDLTKQLGHLVSIRGKATDRRDAKLKIQVAVIQRPDRHGDRRALILARHRREAGHALYHRRVT